MNKLIIIGIVTLIVLGGCYHEPYVPVYYTRNYSDVCQVPPDGDFSVRVNETFIENCCDNQTGKCRMHSPTLTGTTRRGIR